MDIIYISHRLEIAFWNVTIPLLRKPRRRLSSWLILGLGLGILASLWIACNLAVVMVRNINPDQGTMLYRNTLLVLVDNLGDRQPNLKGVWLVVIPAEQPQWKFLPVYPGALEDSPTQDKHLEQSFRLGFKGSLSREFRNLLDEKVSWDHYLVIDEVALSGMADLISPPETGVSMPVGELASLRLLEGLQTAPKLSHPELSPIAVQMEQKILFQIMCQQSNALFRDVEPRVALERFGRHVATDIPGDLWVNQWLRMRDNSRGVVCEFPTLDISSSLGQP
jgi:hypothetical protein